MSKPVTKLIIYNVQDLIFSNNKNFFMDDFIKMINFMLRSKDGN